MTHASARSLRTKDEARSRADVVWTDPNGCQPARLPKNANQQAPILSGGTELSQLVAKADALLLAMRNIVH